MKGRILRLKQLNITFAIIIEQLNLFLTLSLVWFAGYLILFPVFPEVAYAVSQANRVEVESNSSSGTVEAGDLKQRVSQNLNSLVIPSIDVDGKIVLGSSPSLLNDGFWHRPNSSSPPIGGNTVITGHRFLYRSGPNTLYHLDKVAIDDEISVVWSGKTYKYKVFEILEVTPDMVDIEENTDDPILTVYTCTPLWTAEKRLVLRASLISTT